MTELALHRPEEQYNSGVLTTTSKKIKKDVEMTLDCSSLCTYIIGRLLGGLIMKKENKKKPTTIHLLPEDKETAYEKAERLGYSFSVYVQHLIRKDKYEDKQIEY